jgi:nucleotide-binding universal stress UspA family protein
LTDLVTAAEVAHRTSFEHTVDHAGIAPRPTTHLVEGPPARAIHGLAQRYRADLVVLGAGAWHEQWLGLGSTAQQVVAESQSSVLLVRSPHGSRPSRAPDLRLCRPRGDRRTVEA